MFFLRVLLSALLVVWFGAPCALQAGESALLDVTIDQARLIRLNADTAQVIVGNPAIADVAAQSARLLVVTGKSSGTTNLIALDAGDREILSVRLCVREGDVRRVTLYKGPSRQSYHCAPDCQRTLSISDDQANFEQLAGSVTKKFGVVNSAISGN